MRHSSSRSAEPLSEAVVLRAAMFIGLLFAMLITLAVSVVILVSGFASAGKSAYTQAHGVPRAATVTSVTLGGSKASTEDVDVSLASPVDGQQSVTVLVPSRQSFPVGARVQVLIDPQDPGYAEMAGQQFKTDSVAWGNAATCWGIAALFVPLAVITGREWRKVRRRGAPPSAVAGGTRQHPTG
jgi:hypothetical protein